MEVTGPQMVLTMKLTTFAWNVWDGRRKSEVYIFHRFLAPYCLPFQNAGLGQMAICKENHDIPLPSRVPWVLVRLPLSPASNPSHHPTGFTFRESLLVHTSISPNTWTS